MCVSTEQTASQIIIDCLTDFQLKTLELKVWRKITENAGYQAFGYCPRTLKVNNPGQYEALMTIREAMSKRGIE